MASETEGLDHDEQSLLERLRPQLARGPSRRLAGDDLPSVEDLVRSRAPTPHAHPQPERRIVELPPPEDRQRESQHPERDREGADEPGRGLLRRHPFATVLGFVVLVVAAALGYLYWDYARHFETTDDAFIAARQFSIAPKVSGYITAVPVTDNEHVGAGGTIARLDDRDYRIALAQAQAQVDAAQASVQNIDAQIGVQQAQINANEAQVEQAQAALVFAQQQAARYKDLEQKGAGAVMNSQQYSSQLRQQQATLESAQATLKVARRQLESLKAQRSSALANLAQAQAQRDQAQLNLSYTTVTAAQASRVANLGAAVGQFAPQSTALATFVPDEVWVTANYKETQLDTMRPGQPVTLKVDAYPERSIRGHVASVQPGSRTAFSLLPARMPRATTSRSCGACRSRSSWTIRPPMLRSAPACGADRADRSRAVAL